MTDDQQNDQSELVGKEMGIGTWAWGDPMFWGFGRGYNLEDVHEAYKLCIDSGKVFFDTAEVYGLGRSENMIGQFMRELQTQEIIATKFFPFPWRLTKQALFRALHSSLKRLKVQKVALYQIHFPAPPVRVETWMESMAEAKENGWIGEIGVSNYDRDQLQRAYDTLARLGIHLTSNQVEYSLLDRAVETSGLIQHCKDLGVKVIAYSPIAKGALSGKYTPENPMPGFRERRYTPKVLEFIQPLIREMRKIGMDHSGKAPAQVAINWTICKGAVPIPGVKNANQAMLNLDSCGWRLTEAEVARLDELSASVQA